MYIYWKYIYIYTHRPPINHDPNRLDRNIQPGMVTNLCHHFSILVHCIGATSRRFRQSYFASHDCPCSSPLNTCWDRDLYIEIKASKLFDAPIRCGMYSITCADIDMCVYSIHLVLPSAHTMEMCVHIVSSCTVLSGFCWGEPIAWRACDPAPQWTCFATISDSVTCSGHGFWGITGRFSVTDV